MEYSLNLAAPIVSIYRKERSKWVFARNTSLAEAIWICRIESMCFASGLLLAVFPVGADPNSVAAVLEIGTI